MNNNELKIKINGGELVAQVGSDPDFPSIYLFLRRDNGNEYDLAVAEAPITGKNVSVYTYKNPEIDDWTDKFTITAEQLDCFEYVQSEFEEENKEEKGEVSTLYELFINGKSVSVTPSVDFAALMLKSALSINGEKTIKRNGTLILKITPENAIITNPNNKDSIKILSILTR